MTSETPTNFQKEIRSAVYITGSSLGTVFAHAALFAVAGPTSLLYILPSFYVRQWIMKERHEFERDYLHARSQLFTPGLMDTAEKEGEKLAQTNLAVAIPYLFGKGTLRAIAGEVYTPFYGAGMAISAAISVKTLHRFRLWNDKNDLVPLGDIERTKIERRLQPA